MKSVSVRELREDVEGLVRRAGRGESFIVTHDGTKVAELRARPRHSPAPAELVARRRALPVVDPHALRNEIDAVVKDPRS